MKKRPIRNFEENVLNKVPEGPLGFAGKGNAVGAAEYFLISTANRLTPISGIKMGYKIISSSIKRQPDKTVHTYEINAWSKDVARFAARVQAAPSVIGMIADNISIQDVTPIKKRWTVTTWRVRVSVKSRNMRNIMV